MGYLRYTKGYSDVGGNHAHAEQVKRVGSPARVPLCLPSHALAVFFFVCPSCLTALWGLCAGGGCTG